MNQDQIMIIGIIYLIFVIPGDITRIQGQGMPLESQ
ncbi:hypothetical protein ES705_18781 [subsurface metagenome]